MKSRKTKPPDSILTRIAPFSADVLDPFTLNCSLSVYQRLKAIIITVTLLPVRLLIMIALLLFAWIFGITALQGLPEEQKSRKKPISGWRRKVVKPIIEEIARLIFAVAGWHWIPTKGKRATAEEAPILLLVPHSSFWDTIPVMALRCPCMVIKDSVKATPFFGDLLNYSQPVYVKRNDPKSRQRTVEEILRRCSSGDDWEQIIIFPEGTCSNRRALLDFKLGAFYPGVAIQPVFIRYDNSLDTITWTWNGPGTLRQLWLTLAQLHIYCELEFLPVYTPSKEEKKDARLFANNLRRSISKMCKIPMSYFSLEDVRYLDIAAKMELPRTVALVKLLRLRSKMGRENMSVETELNTLSMKAQTTHMLCNLQGFATYLDADISEAMKDFFSLLDQDNSGKIDVRIYDVGLWLLRRELDEWQKLESGFRLVATTGLSGINVLFIDSQKTNANMLFGRSKSNADVMASVDAGALTMMFNSEGVITASQFAAIAFLWRGIPRNVAMDILYLLNAESRHRDIISFRKFKAVAIRFVQLESKVSKSKKPKKHNGFVKNGRRASLTS